MDAGDETCDVYSFFQLYIMFSALVSMVIETIHGRCHLQVRVVFSFFPLSRCTSTNLDAISGMLSSVQFENFSFRKKSTIIKTKKKIRWNVSSGIVTQSFALIQ